MSDYMWTPGAHITADAQPVGEELERLQRRNGERLTARIVVDAARSEESPLHAAFEWDDVRAAERYREDQARHVLACIRIVDTWAEDGSVEKTMRAFVNLTETVGTDEQRAYIPIARVLSDRDLLAQALARAASELRSFEDRYASFEVIAASARMAREQIERSIPTVAQDWEK